jgi:hypothetical protein
VPESLFSRATRYTRSPSLDPHENRLTEITAAVLEHVDGLAQKIAEALLRAACDHAGQALAEGNDAGAYLGVARVDQVFISGCAAGTRTRLPHA